MEEAGMRLNYKHRKLQGERPTHRAPGAVSRSGWVGFSLRWTQIVSCDAHAASSLDVHNFLPQPQRRHGAPAGWGSGGLPAGLRLLSP